MDKELSKSSLISQSSMQELPTLPKHPNKPQSTQLIKSMKLGKSWPKTKFPKMTSKPNLCQSILNMSILMEKCSLSVKQLHKLCQQLSEELIRTEEILDLSLINLLLLMSLHSTDLLLTRMISQMLKRRPENLLLKMPGKRLNNILILQEELLEKYWQFWMIMEPHQFLQFMLMLELSLPKVQLQLKLVQELWKLVTLSAQNTSSDDKNDFITIFIDDLLVKKMIQCKAYDIAFFYRQFIKCIDLISYFKKIMKNKQKTLEGETIFKKFKVGKQLGTGAFGQIFLVINKDNEQEQYAVKCEPMSTKHPQLMFQAKLYKYINPEGKIEGYPQVYAVGSESGYNLMIMDLLSKSTEELFVERNKRFSIKTVLMLGQQLLQRIKYLHTRHFLHRDIKPDNLLMGKGQKQHIMFIVDMGLAKRYMKDGKHIPYKDGKQLTGTARYASISTHMGIEQSRRDDIESIGYVLMYFLRGILPWQNMKASTTKQKYRMIMQKKLSTPLDLLCKDYLPEMQTFINYARNMKFEETPDYDYLHGILAGARKRLGIQFDYKYDWSQK